MIREDNMSVEVCESKAVSVAAVIPMRIIGQGPPRQRPLSFPLQGCIYHLVEQIEH
jgi:hypothetical protein